jgi:hypothetical protein
MGRHEIRSFVVLCGFALLPSLGDAQTALTGAIAGTVRDATGAVLPGVTVEAASPALIEKVRSVVTDNEGLYRVVDLRPGVYTVTFTLPGFATVRRAGLELTTGFTATVNAELRVGDIAETITVSGASPIVDLQNVRQQNVISREVLDTLPSGKWVPAYASMTPGATLAAANTQDVGGNRGEAASSIGIHGIRADDMKMLLDGFRFNNISGSGGGAGRFFMLDVGSIQEITLETGGISAESETGGIQVNGVPKEGGNRFTGSFLTNYTGPDLQTSNLSDELRARGLNSEAGIKKVYDVTMSMGGPIKEDRLWFFTSHRWWGAENYVPGNYFNKTQESWFYTPDLSRPAYLSDINEDHHVRLTWQAATKHKINLALWYQDNCACFIGLTGSVAPEATGAHRYMPDYMATATWSYPATDRLLFQVGANALVPRVTLGRQPGVSVEHISVLDLSSNYTFRSKRSGTVINNLGHQKQTQATQRASMSYITGTHAFKVGFDMQEGWRRSFVEINQDTTYDFLRPGVPQSITMWTTPSWEQNRVMPILGIFGQDQWSIGRLTLNLGVRFDYFNAYSPPVHAPAGRWVAERDFQAVHDAPNWTDLAPRLGVVYDLFGNGRTALKVSAGRYVTPEAVSFNRLNSPAALVASSASRTWNDANGDFIPQDEELGPLSNVNFGKPVQTNHFADDVRTGFGVRPYNWQGSVSIQHELGAGLGLNIGYFRTSYGNFTVTDNLAVTPADYDPYCITAPTDSRLPGGGGNQICGLYDVKPGLFGRVNNLTTQASHYGVQREIFNGVDVTINARLGRGRLLTGGLSTGQKVTDNCFVVDSPEIVRDSFCHVAPPWSAGTQLKFSAIYPLPWDLQASATYQNLPGVPITASFVATNAQISPSLGRDLSSGARGTALVELIRPGTLFEDRITQLDVRLTRVFRVAGTRVQGMFDIYNAFNANSILQQNTRYGSAWLTPQVILAARLFKFGAQVDF